MTSFYGLGFRQAYRQLKCTVVTDQPCGHQNVVANGRPSRCIKKVDTLNESPYLLMTMNACWEECKNWNNNPPPGLGRLPCVGFESSGNLESTSNGVCALIRTSLNSYNDTFQCPRNAGAWKILPERSNPNFAHQAYEVCRLVPLHNINEPTFKCFAVYNASSSDTSCPTPATCSLTASNDFRF